MSLCVSNLLLCKQFFIVSYSSSDLNELKQEYYLNTDKNGKVKRDSEIEVKKVLSNDFIMT